MDPTTDLTLCVAPGPVSVPPAHHFDPSAGRSMPQPGASQVTQPGAPGIGSHGHDCGHVIAAPRSSALRVVEWQRRQATRFAAE